jgi:hypothetical protein
METDKTDTAAAAQLQVNLKWIGKLQLAGVMKSL